MPVRLGFSVTEKVLLWAMFLFSWTLLWLKAIVSPVTQDEIATFFYYIQSRSFIPFFAIADPNNHVLNSAVTSLFYSLFGDSAVVLRLANLLSFPLYYFFIIKIAWKLKNDVVKWVFVLVLVFSNGLVDFFSLCRGYGMSMAFLLGSLYFILKTLHTYNIRHHLGFLFFALLSFISNQTLLVSFIMIFGLFLLLQIKNYKPGLIRNIVFILADFVLAVIPLLYFIKYLIMLQTTGGLYYGSHAGFWSWSVPTLLFMFTGINGPVFPYIFLVLFFIMIIFFIIIIIRKKFLPLADSPEILFFALLCISIISIYIMGEAMSVNYPEDRTGLYLFPYFIGSLFFLLDKMLLVKKNKLLMLVLIPLLFFPVSFLVSGCFSKDGISYPEKIIYRGDRFPKRFFDQIYAEHKTGDFPASIGGNSIKMFSWAYYNYRNDGSQSSLQFWDYPSTAEEYQIVRTDEIHGWKNYYDSIDYDSQLGLILMKRKKPYRKVLLDTILVTSTGITNKEFLNIAEIRTDSLINKSLYLGYRLSFSTAAIPFNSKIFIDLTGNHGEKISEQYISLNWLKLKYSGDKTNFINGLLIRQVAPGVKTIKTYVRNYDKTSYNVTGVFYLFEMKS